MKEAPLFEDIADGPTGGAAHWLTTADGLRIRVAHWPKKDARGTVVIFPGRTEYIEKYGPAARDLGDRGYAAVAVDWRGQGLADRMIENRTVGHVGEFSDYQHDVTAVAAHLSDIGMPKPYYLIGHSMGGCIGLRAAMQGLNVKAVAFSGPMWGIEMARAMRPFAWGMTTVSMTLGFDKLMSPGQSAESYVIRTPFEENTLTNDREMYDFLRQQMTAQPDLILGGPSLRWLGKALREMRQLSTEPSPNLPCITFVGSKETIVDPTRIHARMAKWTRGSLRVIEGGQHEMLLDTPELRKTIFDEITTLFDAHR